MTKKTTYEQFVNTHGRQFGPVRKLSGGDHPGHCYGQCYGNAATLVLYKSRESLTYVEGIGHAWAIDKEGRVIDPSETDDWVFQQSYFGVPYRTKWLRKIVDQWGGFAEDMGLWLPSLDILVFEPKGWEALAVGIRQVEGTV